MASSIRDAMKRAFQESGQDLPKKQSTTSRRGPSVDFSRDSRRAQKTTATSVKNDHRVTGKLGLQGQSNSSSSHSPKARSVSQIISPAMSSGNGKSHNTVSAVYVAPQIEPGPLPKPPPLWQISLGHNPFVSTIFSKNSKEKQLLMPEGSGIGCRPKHSYNSDDVREIILGLDFGTSSAKVVIGDRAAGIAFAVPFMSCEGIDQYLLPCRIRENKGVFSLHKGNQIHRNLKLSLLAEGNIDEAQKCVVAFLALVIRHARAWLFSEKAEIYEGTQIVWKMVIGIPSENIHEMDYLKSAIVQRFLLVARAAWVLAGEKSIVINRKLTELSISRTTQIGGGDPIEMLLEDVEIDVVPELSAQIYGFLKSNQFDRRGNNIFVVVDIGAGTVDSALFKVDVARGKWNFEFYTNYVQPLGVMNLHRTRIDWWVRALSEVKDSSGLIDSLQAIELPTDRMSALPEILEDYVSNIEVKFAHHKHHPDWDFFMKKVVSLVRGKTIYCTWKDGFLDQRQLVDVPFFLCGGGSRMNYYSRLRSELKHFEGCTWLKASPRELEIPKDLKAPGVDREEYDRLSVAYGLSCLEVGKIVKKIPPPIVPKAALPSWKFSDKFVSKDDV